MRNYSTSVWIPAWLRLAFLDLRQQKKFCLAFICCLSIGLVGFIFLESTRSSLLDFLHSQAKNILGADFRVSARRHISSEELKLLEQNLPQGAQKRQELQLFSMVTSKDQSRLLQLIAVDSKFPFYPSLTLKNAKQVGLQNTQRIQQNKEVWVYPEVLEQLQSSVGSTVSIGGQDYKIADVVENDVSVQFGRTAFAPRIYIGLEQLKSTDLVGQKSLATHSLLYKLPAQVDFKQLQERLSKILTAPDLSIQTPIEGSENSGRIIMYVTDYLGLISLIALLLAGMGSFYLLHALMHSRMRDVAILKCVGSSYAFVRNMYLSQVLFLTALSVLLSCVLCLSFMPVVSQWAAPFLPSGFQASISLTSVWVAMLLAFLGSLLLCLPAIGQMKKISAQALLSHKVLQGQQPQNKWMWLLTVGFFWGLAVRQAHSFVVGSIFTAIVAVVFTLIFVLGRSLFYFLEKVFPKSFSSRIAFYSINRKSKATQSYLLAVGIASFLVSLGPQLGQIALNELKNSTTAEKPSLFLFDIQQEQKAEFSSMIRNWWQENAKEASNSDPIISIDPLVRARLISINDKQVKQQRFRQDIYTREQEFRRRMENRTFNLTFKSMLNPAESIVAGQPFPAELWDPKQDIHVSIEQRFAKRLNIKLGDILGFEISSVPIKAKVSSLRKVNWWSMMPNFFVVFQQGVLEEAPKTYIAALASMSQKQSLQLQRMIVDKFSNISVIDVSRLVKQVGELFVQVRFIVEFMAWLVLLAGVAVIFSVSLFQSIQHKQDHILLKALGASFEQLQLANILEFAIVSASAAFVGGSLSMGAGYVLSKWVLESDFILVWQIPALCFILLSFFTVLVGYLMNRKNLNTPTAQILAES